MSEYYKVAATSQNHEKSFVHVLPRISLGIVLILLVHNITWGSRSLHIVKEHHLLWHPSWQEQSRAHLRAVEIRFKRRDKNSFQWLNK